MPPPPAHLQGRPVPRRLLHKPCGPKHALARARPVTKGLQPRGQVHLGQAPRHYDRRGPLTSGMLRLHAFQQVLHRASASPACRMHPVPSPVRACSRTSHLCLAMFSPWTSAPPGRRGSRVICGSRGRQRAPPSLCLLPSTPLCIPGGARTFQSLSDWILVWEASPLDTAASSSHHARSSDSAWRLQGWAPSDGPQS